MWRCPTIILQAKLSAAADNAGKVQGPSGFRSIDKTKKARRNVKMSKYLNQTLYSTLYQTSFHYEQKSHDKYFVSNIARFGLDISNTEISRLCVKTIVGSKSPNQLEPRSSPLRSPRLMNQSCWVPRYRLHHVIFHYISISINFWLSYSLTCDTFSHWNKSTEMEAQIRFIYDCFATFFKKSCKFARPISSWRDTMSSTMSLNLSSNVISQSAAIC